MEDDVGREALHHLEHAVGLAAVGEHSLDPGEVPLLEHLAVDLEEVVLGVVEQDQELRVDLGDLTAELGADRAAGAGDEDDAVAQVGADAVELTHDRVAAEHVLDPNLAQLAVELDAAAQQLEHGRQGADADLTLAAGGDDFGPQRPGRRGDRDHDLVRFGLVEDLRHLLGRAEHLQAQHPHPALARVVVDEADRGGARLGLSCSSRTTIWPPEPARPTAPRASAGAAAGRALHHQRTARRAPVSSRVRMKSVTSTERGKAGERLDTAKTMTRKRAGDGDGADDQDEVATAEVAPPLLVEPEGVEDGELADDEKADRLREQRLVAGRQPLRLVEKRSWKARK